jgi:hypothetical protein
MKYFLTVLAIITSFSEVFAQESIQAHLNIGENNVSEGIYIKNIYRSSYQYSKYKLDAGIQLDILSHNPNALTGFDLIGSREFLIKNFFFEVKGYFMLNRFSDLMHETNWGLRIATKNLKYFLFELGTNSRTYALNTSFIKEYNISKSNSKLNENFNLTYVFTAYLKPQDYSWNVGFSCTNVDYYVINQSTNPVFKMQILHKLRSNLLLNFSVWYKQAGIFNINANYFGYFFRGGITWKI